MRSEVRRRVSHLRELVRSRALDEAAREAESAVSDYPESAELLAAFADIHRRRKKLDEAKALLERARAIDPFHETVVAVAADLAYDEGDFKEAAARYQHLVDRRATSYYYSRLVMSTNRLGEPEAAAAMGRQALERFPRDPWILRGLAAAEAKSGRRQDAVAAYEELLEIDPKDRFAYKELMRLKTEEASPEEAAAALKGLMRTGSRASNPHLKTLTAERLRKAGKLEDAAAEYEAALELQPANTYVLSQLGFTYKKLGREEEALEALSKAFLGKPSDPYVRKSLESLLRKRHEMGHYLVLIDEAIKRHPSLKSLYGIRKRVSRLVDSQNQNDPG